MKTQEQKTVIRLDASALKNSSCTLRLYRDIIKGYREPLTNNDIQYGTAVHKFIDVCYKTNGDVFTASKAAIECYNSVPRFDKEKKLYMTDNHLKAVCNLLYIEYLQGQEFDILKFADNSLAIEYNFALPYYEDEDIIVLLTGTIDRIGKIKNGCYCIRDWKTTSSSDIRDYFSSYAMSTQLMFYTLCLKLHKSLLPNSPLAFLSDTQIGAAIDGIFIKPDIGKCQFVSSEVYIYKEEQINNFKTLLDDKIQQLKKYIVDEKNRLKEGLINGSCEQKFGKCKYFFACASGNSIAEEHMLSKNFIVKQYDPATFH